MLGRSRPPSGPTNSVNGRLIAPGMCPLGSRPRLRLTPGEPTTSERRSTTCAAPDSSPPHLAKLRTAVGSKSRQERRSGGGRIARFQRTAFREPLRNCSVENRRQRCPKLRTHPHALAALSLTPDPS